MNRTPDQSRDGVDVRRRSATHDGASRVDETQSARQEATAPQPRIDRTEIDDDLSAADLDEAWGRLSAALIAADEDFDAAAAYASLSRSLPRDLVAIALVERASVRRTVDARLERRNFAWGLAAMLTVCAGLGALAFYGPTWERRGDRMQEHAAVDATQVEAPSSDPSRVERPSGVSLSPSETWEDEAWNERFAELLSEFDAERRHLARPVDHYETGDFAVRQLEHNFARLRHDFERQPGF